MTRTSGNAGTGRGGAAPPRIFAPGVAAAKRRRRDLLDQLAAAIRARGGTVETATADVADRDRLLAAVGSLTDRLGPVDLLVANAGVGIPTKWDPPNVPEQVRMIEVNLFGVMYAIEAVLPDMLRRGAGHVAAVSSLAAYQGIPGSGGYSASKAAVNNYVEA